MHTRINKDFAAVPCRPVLLCAEFEPSAQSFVSAAALGAQLLQCVADFARRSRARLRTKRSRRRRLSAARCRPMARSPLVLAGVVKPLAALVGLADVASVADGRTVRTVVMVLSAVVDEPSVRRSTNRHA